MLTALLGLFSRVVDHFGEVTPTKRLERSDTGTQVLESSMSYGRAHIRIEGSLAVQFDLLGQQVAWLVTVWQRSHEQDLVSTCFMLQQSSAHHVGVGREEYFGIGNGHGWFTLVVKVFG